METVPEEVRNHLEPVTRNGKIVVYGSHCLTFGKYILLKRFRKINQSFVVEQGEKKFVFIDNTLADCFRVLFQYNGEISSNYETFTSPSERKNLEEAYFQRTGYRYVDAGQGSFKHVASQASAKMTTRETQTLNIRFKPVVDTIDKETTTADLYQNNSNQTYKNTQLIGEFFKYLFIMLVKFFPLHSSR